MKSGIHAKLKWLTGDKASPAPQLTSPVQPDSASGWLSPQTSETLLSTPLRQRLMKIIWQRTSLSGALFKELYQTPVARFAELVQLLPASEYHHHSHPGGLLDHTLEVMAFAAKLRQRHLLPAGAAPEDQAREAEAWTTGIIYAALLHDAGKIIVDMDIITRDNQHWYPWQGVLQKPYRLKYRKNRDHQLHPVAGGLLALQILPPSALNWLAQYRELSEAFMYCVCGHYDRAGITGELVQEADRASVAQFMGANASQALERPQPSLPKQLLTALRELVQSTFKLNNPHSGSDGWLTEDALWLVSKTTADKVRAWLLQQGVTGIPDNNVRLFDEMQAHGLIVPTPEDKAIWSCNITANSGWAPGCPLTLLRLPPSRLWSTPEERPTPFAGKVVPVRMATDMPEPAADEPPFSAMGETEPSLTDLAFSLFTLPDDGLSDIPDSQTVTGNTEEVPLLRQHATTQENNNQQPAGVDDGQTPSSFPASSSEHHFTDWLRQGIQSRSIAVNDAKAPVHMVQGKAFLVSPGIFKLYVRMTSGKTGNEWVQVQKSFQKLGLHHRDNDGVNIFVCEVAGPRRTRQVKGYLLERPEDIFGNVVPEDNPYLSILSQVI